MSLHRFTLVLTFCLLRAAAGYAGYDAVANLKQDLKRVSSIELCESDKFDGSAMTLTAIVTIDEKPDVRTVVLALRAATLEAMPNGAKSFGVPLYAAFLDSRRNPLFAAYLSPFGEHVTILQWLKRNDTGRLSVISSNIHHDPPNYLTRDEDFHRAVYGVFKKLTPERSKAYWDAPF